MPDERLHASAWSPQASSYAAVTSLYRSEIKWQAKSNCYTDCVIIQLESTGGNWHCQRSFLAEGKTSSHERRLVSLIGQKEVIPHSWSWINALQNALPAWWCARGEEFSLHKPKLIDGVNPLTVKDWWCVQLCVWRLPLEIVLTFILPVFMNSVVHLSI